MIGIAIDCAREGCGVRFTKTTHNMKYCTPECCRIATNAKIVEKYHEKVAIKNGKKRLCNRCGITQLSRYNDGTLCGGCVTSSREGSRETAEKLLAAVSLM